MPPTSPPGQIEAAPQPFSSHDAGAGGPADEYKRRLREERARSGTTIGVSPRGIPS